MKTIDEMCAVMQAFKNGKQIEYKLSETSDWVEVSNPIWNWGGLDYRVKPEPKYVPYDSASEIDKSKWVREKAFSCRLKAIGAINTANNEVFITAAHWFTLGEFFEMFEYEDGTPCGKRVE